MWIATDQDGEQYIFEDKPVRDGKVWTNNGDSRSLKIFPFRDNLPSFIQQQQWKDAPIQVKVSIVKK